MNPFANWKSWSLITLGLASVFALTVDSGFVVWMAMETGLLLMTPLMSSGLLSNSEAVVKYFLIQAVSGLIVLYSWVSAPFMSTLFVLGLSLKMGLAPTHYWVSAPFWKLFINKPLMLTWR